MKFRKSVLFMLLLVFSLTVVSEVHAEETTREIWFERDAVKLSEIGMFKGTSKGFELDRQPTRAESAVIIARLLGKEYDAREKNYPHPFKDVPTWASACVGYLYHENIVGGVSPDKFGSNEIINANQFFTLLLRVLGYDDKKGDFKWDESIDKALEINLISEDQAYSFKNNTLVFIRDDVAHYLMTALNLKLKDSEMRLIDKLIEDNVFTLDDVLDAGFYFVLFGRFTQVETKGIITGYNDLYKPRIDTYKDIKFLELDTFRNDEKRWITSLDVVGEDFKEYTIVLEKDYQFDPDSLIGKSITFSGELLPNWMATIPSVRYVDLENYFITGLQNDTDYESVIFSGQFKSYSHGTIGGEASFMFTSDDGSKYHALMGSHHVIDVEKRLEGEENFYYYYNLGEYTDQDVCVKGYKKNDSNILVVNDFGRNYTWDVKSNQWVEREQENVYDGSKGYPITDLKLSEIIEEDSEKVIIKALSDNGEREELKLIFVKDNFNGKIPNEQFIGKRISIRCTNVNDGTYSTLNVLKWDYNGVGGHTSSSYVKLMRIIDETSAYVEFEIKTEDALVSKARLYKRDFINIDFESLVGKSGYVSGNYVYDNLDMIKVLEWIQM